MNIKPGVKKAVDRMQSSRALPAEAERCEVAQAAWPSEAEGQRGVSPPLCPPSSMCSRGTGPAQTHRCSGPPEAGGPGRPCLAPAWLRPEPQPRCVLRGGRPSPSPLAVDGRAAVKRHAGRCAASATGASPLAMCSAALTLQPPSKERNGVAPCARSHLLLGGGGAFAL